MKDMSPETKKESWRAAGSHQVKIMVRAGKPQVMSAAIWGVRVVTAVSPPRWGRQFMFYVEGRKG